MLGLGQVKLGQVRLGQGQVRFRLFQVKGQVKGQVKLSQVRLVQFTVVLFCFKNSIQISSLLLLIIYNFPQCFYPMKNYKKYQYTNFTPDLTSIYKFTPCFDPQKIMKIDEILYTIFTTVLIFQYTNGPAVLVVKSIHWIIQNYTHSPQPYQDKLIKLLIA